VNEDEDIFLSESDIEWNAMTFLSFLQGTVHCIMSDGSWKSGFPPTAFAKLMLRLKATVEVISLKKKIFFAFQ
jgi:hypothetical protein